MNGENEGKRGLEKLQTFLLWLLIGELIYIFILATISIFAWPSDAIWGIFYNAIGVGVLIPLFIAFLFNLGGALFGLITYALRQEDQREQISRSVFLYNWIIVAAIAIPYLILLLQISFNILGRVRFFETYF